MKPSQYVFRGTERFELLAPLGAGGMGVVFEAHDREHRCNVALKVLPSLSPGAVGRFKNEFRALQGIHHPNLVNLGELIEHEGRLFFTMDLVRGVDIVSYVHRVEAREKAKKVAVAGTSEPTLRRSGPGPADWRATPAPVPARLDEKRLRSSFAQLAGALTMLHAHHKVHRDIKPSNVLVTEEGRVVLLDFGLIVDASMNAQPEEIRMGTASYMSPEQAAGAGVSPASDWYGVGAVLYEAMTGRPPFAGTVEEILHWKQHQDAPRPSGRSKMPEDLHRLCAALLRRDARLRPDGAHVLSVMSPGTKASFLRSVRREGDAVPFVGRHRELARLHEVLRGVDRKPVIVTIEGESGVGKSLLAQVFLNQARLAGDEAPLVLRGRCSEREHLPFKAFDAIAEAMAARLPRLVERDSERPDRAAHLARASNDAALAFPVFSPAGPSSDPRSQASPDPVARRRLAFRGIRNLLSALAEDSPVVLCIDDWQWADADSHALFSAFLSPPAAPPILVLLIRRSGEVPIDLPGPIERIQLANLDPDDARELARTLLSDGGEVHSSSDDAAADIAAESIGHPLFIAELVRQVLAHGAVPQRRPRLDDALWSRFCALEPTARRAAELLATARSPLPLSLLCEAMSIADRPLAWSDLLALMAQLRTENLARFDGLRGGDRVDCFHDRVASSISKRLLESDRCRCHRALAAAFERLGSGDFESLAAHWRGAGEPDRAADYAVLAADRAMQALGFERAAQLYLQCLESSRPASDISVLYEKLGNALSHIGRGHQAAEAYLAAVSSGATDRRVELFQLAADQLFRSGYIDDAVSLIEQVLQPLNLTLPKTPRQAITRLAWRRMQLRLRGIGFRRRTASGLPREALARVDASWSVAIGLSTVDNLRGAYLQSRHLLMALELGEPFRILRALAAEAGYRATRGKVAASDVDKLLDAAEALARDLEDPYAYGFTHLARGLGMFLRGEFVGAKAACDAAESIFEARPMMASWELATARMFSTWALFCTGELAGICSRVPELVREAEARGDLYAATCLRLSACNLAWLLVDEPAEARRQLIEADERWSHRGLHFQHYWSMVAWVNLELYEGRPAAAYERVARIAPLLEQSLLLRIELMRVELGWLQAKTALALACREPARRNELLRESEHFARRLLGERVKWAHAAGHVVLAGVLAVQDDREAALQQLRLGLQAAEASGFRVVIAVVRRALGESIDEADRRSLAPVVRFDRWSAVVAPGLDHLALDAPRS